MKSFNLLIDSLPNDVLVNEECYVIRSDFRSILTILSIMEDPLFSLAERRSLALGIFYEKIPKKQEQAYEEMLRFIRMYSEPNEEKESGEENPSIDYQQDAAEIFSAFFQLYRLDLSQCDLHWFVFQTLLDHINDGTPHLVTLRDIRTRKITPDMSEQQRTELMKAKQKYGIKVEEPPKSELRLQIEASIRKRKHEEKGDDA